MKTPEQWSAEIINPGTDDGGEVTIRFGGRALVLKGLAAQHVDRLREIVAAGLRACAEEALDAFSARAQASSARAVLAAPKNGIAAPAGSSTTGPTSGRGLYGLPCSHCGAYFESSYETCPVCSGEQAAAEPAGRAAEHSDEPRPFPQTRGPFSGDLLREGIGAEIVDACVRYGARMERMEAALHTTPEDAARTVYETLFPSQARVQPWERCPQDFRSAYVLRVAVLLQDLRRRAGLEPGGDSEFTIEAGPETVPARLCN